MLLKNVLAYKILAYRKDTKNLWGPPAHTLGSSETKDVRPLTGQALPGTPPRAARAPREGERRRGQRKRSRAAVSCAGSSCLGLAVTYASSPPSLPPWWALHVRAVARLVSCQKSPRLRRRTLRIAGGRTRGRRAAQPTCL